jgi:hypothetical protein
MTCALITEKGSALLTGAAVVVSCPVVAAGLPGRTAEERTLAALWNLLPTELLGIDLERFLGSQCGNGCDCADDGGEAADLYPAAGLAAATALLWVAEGVSGCRIAAAR